jgi:hypothetical protein
MVMVRFHLNLGIWMRRLSRPSTAPRGLPRLITIAGSAFGMRLLPRSSGHASMHLRLPLGAPGDLPLCIRHRPFGIAGDLH